MVYALCLDIVVVLVWEACDKMSMLYESISIQDTIIASIKALFTHSISSQADSVGYLVFTISEEHDFQDGGILKISGVIDGDGLDLGDYNQTFKIHRMISSTEVVVAKEQSEFGFEVEYDATADFSGATVTNIRVHNDPTKPFDDKDYPIVLVDIDDTIVNKESSGMFIPDETYFPISVLHRLYQFTEGQTTQLRACRYFVAYKLQQILDEIRLKVVGNVGRLETIWGSEEVSVIGVTVKK